MRFLDENRSVLQIPPRANIQIKSLYRTKRTTASGYLPPEEVILEFVWNEDIELRGKEFRDLDEKRVTLPCGGTLVFDRRGNVLHYVLAGDTEERRAALRTYVARLVARGRMGLRERGFGGDDLGHHYVRASADGERVSFRRAPALRHGTARFCSYRLATKTEE